jgi:sugar phosphate isomerase/epimerase
LTHAPIPLILAHQKRRAGVGPIIAVNTMAYQGFDLSTTLEEISRLGVRYIELAFTMGYAEGFTEETFSRENAQNLRAMLSDHGLMSVAVAAHMDLGQPESVEAFKRRMEFANGLGAGIIHTNATQAANQDVFYGNMEELADLAESAGVTIALENPGDGADNVIGTGQAGAKVIERIGSKHVRLNYDFGNVFSYSKGEVKPEEDFQFALPHSVHLHVKDMVRQGEAWCFSEIGKGVINYTEILQSLAQYPELPPMSIETPRTFKRTLDFAPLKDPSPLDLREIRDLLKGSIEYLRESLATRPQPLSGPTA